MGKSMRDARTANVAGRPHLSIVREPPPPPAPEPQFDDEWTTRTVRSTLSPVADGYLSGSLELGSDEGAPVRVELRYCGMDAAGAPTDGDVRLIFDGLPVEAFDGVVALLQRLATLARRDGVFEIARPARRFDSNVGDDADGDDADDDDGSEGCW